MFTSRAEYRLSLRADNADLRLTEKGIAAGCVGETRTLAFQQKQEALHTGRAQLETHTLLPKDAVRHGLVMSQDGTPRTARQILAYPDMDWQKLCAIWPDFAVLPSTIAEQLEIEALYHGYLDRQNAEIRQFRKDEYIRIPDDIDYVQVASLSNEVREKLQRIRPHTLGQAGRIPGVTPAAITAVMVHIRQRESGAKTKQQHG